MANYLLVVLDKAGHQWLLSLPENQFHSWAQLKQAFINNFIATCDQPGNKYDLERIHDRAGEPLRDYIRRFSDMHLKIPKISHNEAVSAFIKGLRHHDALKSKLLRKWPTMISELPITTRMLMMPRRLLRKTWVGHHALNTHHAVTTIAMTMVGTIVIGAMTTTTSQTTVIGGMTTATPLEASVRSKKARGGGVNSLIKTSTRIT
jgi:hypothetical protein